MLNVQSLSRALARIRSKLLPVLLLAAAMTVHAQDRPAYRIFDRQGGEVTYARMVQAITRADVVFFGETHDDAMSHWLELQVLKSLHAHDANAPRLTLAMEMFEGR